MSSPQCQLAAGCIFADGAEQRPVDRGDSLVCEPCRQRFIARLDAAEAYRAALQARLGEDRT